MIMRKIISGSLVAACAVGLYRLWHNSVLIPARVKAEPPAEQILAERFGRAEIDESEYRTELAVLRESDVV